MTLNKKTNFFNFILIAFTIFSLCAGAKGDFKSLHVEDLAKILDAEKSKDKDPAKSVMIFDCNVDSTRKNVGVIPGATLLDSSSEYEVSKYLPNDKKTPLVFYCANTMCTASHSAAHRAIAAGYTDVSVMVDGIYGWQKANKKMTQAKWTATSIEPKAAFELVKKGRAVIVDVREDEERHEVIEGAKWIPMSETQDPQKWSKLVKDLANDKTIIFHCAAGVRAKKIAEKLSAEGIKSAYFKGPDQWKDEGLPVQSRPSTH